MQRPLRIAMVAGEASGDLLASHLIAALKSRLPDAQFFGIGGPRMEGQGFDAWFPQEKLAVRGYVEVLRHYREITGIRRKLKRRLLADPPDVFIGVDAPDFNLDLERALKKRGIPTIHYVSPSIWAWRGGRAKKIARSASHLLTLFPFEAKLYEPWGLPVTYVGHPMADLMPMEPDRAAVRERLGLNGGRTVVALLPGSRQSELEFHAELFVDVAKLILTARPEAQILVPLATRQTRERFELALYRREAQELPIRLLFGHAQDALQAADVALVASGTATLEAGLAKTPHVIAYRMAGLSWQIMRRLAYQPWIGLPNILAARFIVPEFLQHDATPENLAQALLNLLGDAAVRGRVIEAFATQHAELRQNTADKAALAVLEVIAASQARS